MAQYDFGTIDPTTKSGTALAADLNDWRTAVHTNHAGVARPSYAIGGMTWTKQVSSSNWEIYLYDGDTDILLSAVNPTTNAMIPMTIAQGGTGAATAAAARTALGLVIGTDVQAYNATLASIAAGSYSFGSKGLSNLAVNGSFECWRLGLTFNISSSYVFVADQWKAALVSGSGWTVAMSALSQAASYYGMKCQRTAAQTTTALFKVQQVMETKRCTRFRNKKVSVSFDIMKGANFSPTAGVLVELYTGTGSDQSTVEGFTGSAVPAGGSITVAPGQMNTSTMTRFSFTTTAALASTINQLGILFSAAGSGTAGADDSFTIDNVMINEGATADDYQHLPYEIEDSICAYFAPVFEWTGGSKHAGIAQNTGSAGGIVPFSFEKATRDTITGAVVSSANHFVAVSAGGSGIAVTGMSFSTGSRHQASFTFSVASGLVAGDACLFIASNTASKIIFTGAQL